LSDTRDDTVSPTIGSYFTAYAELAQSFTSDNKAAPFSKYGIEYRKLIPDQTKRYTFAFRGKFESTLGGEDIPFFERSMLGGQNSLRGFGVGRFVDDHSLVVNLEERIQLFHLRLFGTVAEIETAPFLDIGKVLSNFRYRTLAQYEFNPGIGFRAIARPNVVGRVDVATSKDGNAVFAGLDFPF
jgi:outer membrane protein assembly factor BamA